ncbi:MAG: SRPBCC family protein, partial [Planctomycetota bacterium]
MFERTFEKTTRLPVPPAEAFAWHTKPGAFERLSPPWDDTKVLEYGGIKDGQRVVLRVKAPWPRRWVAEHEDYLEGLQFKDRQVVGPFPKWVHTHRTEPIENEPTACLMRDAIEFKLPAGPLGIIAYRLFMRKQIEAMFDHRHATLAADLVDHGSITRGRKFTVAVTGASGMIGTALLAYLRTGGHAARTVPRKDGLSFDIDAVRGADVVVHLAGEPIFQRWDDEVKDRVRRSRVDRTRVLCEQLARLPEAERPEVLLSGSATG